MQITLPLDMVVEVLILVASLAGMWALMRADLKSLQTRVGKIEDRHDSHVEKLDSLCNEVRELIGRFDMLLNLGRTDAIKRVNA